jgi:DNA-binding NarL/FixJ family response regulator
MPVKNGNKLRVLLADDHPALREGLKALFLRHGLEVVAEVSDGRAAVDAALKLRPDVLVLDVAMPVLNGVEAARAIADAAPRSAIVLLTALSDGRFVLDALRAGVRGFVDKSQESEALLHAIHEVFGGGVYFGPGAAQAVVDACVAPGGGRLTRREQQVMRLIADGKSTRGIAQELGISVKTAEFHRGRIMGKLKIHNTAGLVRYAIREGMVSA